jgi:hypothetical protein
MNCFENSKQGLTPQIDNNENSKQGLTPQIDV